MGIIAVCLFAAACSREPIQLVPPLLPERDSTFVILRDEETTWNALHRAIEATTDATVRAGNRTAGEIDPGELCSGIK